MSDPTPRPGVPVEVLWTDSMGEHGWSDNRSISADGLSCRSIGYLLRDDETGVEICMGATDGQRLCKFLIPRSAVNVLKRLEV
jgi:hypothetical protein